MRLRKWVKVVLYFLFLIIVILIIKNMFTNKITVITEAKNYTCYGTIVKVCRGDDYDL